MLLQEEADTVASMGNRVLLRYLDHLACGDAPQCGHIVKPDFGETVDDGFGAGLHEGDAILAHGWELLHIRDMALQPAMGEPRPAHIGAALEARGIFEARWSGMVDDRMLRQVQALASSQVCVGVGACRLAAARSLNQSSAMPSKGPSCASAAREMMYRRSPGSFSTSALCWPSHQAKKSGWRRS